MKMCLEFVKLFSLELKLLPRFSFLLQQWSLMKFSSVLLRRNWELRHCLQTNHSGNCSLFGKQSAQGIQHQKSIFLTLRIKFIFFKSKQTFWKTITTTAITIVTTATMILETVITSTSYFLLLYQLPLHHLTKIVRKLELYFPLYFLSAAL